MKSTLMIFLLLFTGHAVAAQKCMVTHVREAMELNRVRRELYRQDGNHDAARIMNQLILLEKFMLPGSRKLDRSVEQLQQHGVAMWCDDLTPMDRVSPYQNFSTPPELAYKAWPKKERKALTKRLRRFRFEQRQQTYDAIKTTIETILADSHYHCLSRHFLEAMAHSIKQSQEHLDRAPEDLKEKVVRAVERLVRQTARAMVFANMIDDNAAEIQARGVPVLCQEMPPIPWL